MEKAAKQEEKSGKVVIERSKVLFETRDSTYNVNYLIYASDEDTTNEITSEILNKYKTYAAEHHACFSRLRGKIITYFKNTKTIPNRVRFHCNHKLNSNPNAHLNDNEIARWVELCKNNKLMPDNIGENFIFNKEFDIDIANLSINKIYLYLIMARYVQENPHFIKAILYLIDRNNIEFLVAFVIASMICINGTTHHAIYIGSRYGLKSDKTTEDLSNHDDFKKIDVSMAIKLGIYARSEDKGTPIKKYLKDASSDYLELPQFNIQDNISRVKIVDSCDTYFVPINEINNPLLKEAVNTGKINGKLF